MLGHFTLHWASVKKKCCIKMAKLYITHVWICLIASTQGNCIIRVLVTIWCSNNFPSMMYTYVNFWYPDTIWGPLLQYSAILAAVLFLVCVVLSRNCYACFILLFCFVLFYAECFWVFVCEWLSVCLYSMCVRFIPLLFSPYHNLTIILLTELWQFCLMYKDKNTDVYFSSYETCHL